MNSRRPPAAALILFALLAPLARGADTPLELNLRSRVKTPGKEGFVLVEKKAAWDAKKTALIICDMWDDHWCRSAAKRVAELAGPMNETVRVARGRGVFIIHAP